MKSVSSASGGSAPLQTLQKSKSKNHKWTSHEGTTRNDKTDKVREYMERKFYEQFMPKRDANSRIRKLTLDKDTIRRAHGNLCKRPLRTDHGRNTSVSGPRPPKTGSSNAEQKQRKPKASRLSSQKPEEICAMVLADIRDL